MGGEVWEGEIDRTLSAVEGALKHIGSLSGLIEVAQIRIKLHPLHSIK
jgi:hypothetical protein